MGPTSAARTPVFLSQIVRTAHPAWPITQGRPTELATLRPPSENPAQKAEGATSAGIRWQEPPVRTGQVGSPKAPAGTGKRGAGARCFAGLVIAAVSKLRAWSSLHAVLRQNTSNRNEGKGGFGRVCLIVGGPQNQNKAQRPASAVRYGHTCAGSK